MPNRILFSNHVFIPLFQIVPANSELGRFTLDWIHQMKTIWEKEEGHGGSGGCRTSALLMETIERIGGGGGGNESLLESSGEVRIVQEEECNSWSSSSIGEDSDGDHEGDAESRNEFDHRNKNGSFDDAIQALEEALPIRRGISTFYNGKSKSFASLTDVWPATTSSIQDVAKPENAYTRKRRNLGAFKLSNRRISKKPKTRTEALHFTLDGDDGKHATQSLINRSLSSRSFSMVNLNQCKWNLLTTTFDINCLAESSNMDKH